MQLTPKQKDKLFQYSIPLGIIILVGSFFLREYSTVVMSIGIAVVWLPAYFNPRLDLTLQIDRMRYRLDDIGILQITDQNRKSKFELAIYEEEHKVVSRMFSSKEAADYYFNVFEPTVTEIKNSHSTTIERVK